MPWFPRDPRRRKWVARTNQLSARLVGSTGYAQHELAQIFAPFARLSPSGLLALRERPEEVLAIFDVASNNDEWRNVAEALKTQRFSMASTPGVSDLGLLVLEADSVLQGMRIWVRYEYILEKGVMEDLELPARSVTELDSSDVLA